MIAVQQFVLPWPPKEVSPNARGHWAATARAKKKYREACAWTAKSQGGQRIEAERLTVALTFVPPDRRARDWDNMVASAKAGLDGLADVLGVDDSRWTLQVNVERNLIGGYVAVEVTA